MHHVLLVRAINSDNIIQKANNRVSFDLLKKL